MPAYDVPRELTLMKGTSLEPKIRFNQALFGRSLSASIRQRKRAGESLQHQSGKINLMEPVDTLRYSADVGQKLGKYIAANKPVVVTGLRDFPPLKWTVESLEERYGDTMIRVVVSDSQEFKYDEKKERTIVRMTLSEFIDRGIRNLGADGKYYALGRGLSTQFEGLTDEIVLPDQIARHYQGIGRFLERNLWMSHGGTRTALHFDTLDNFNIQVVGEKRFWLYPTKIEGMYPMKLNSQASYLSPVDPRKVDREKYPKFRRAAPSRLSPGLMICSICRTGGGTRWTRPARKIST